MGKNKHKHNTMKNDYKQSAKLIALITIMCTNTVWTKAENDFDPYVYDTLTYDKLDFGSQEPGNIITYHAFSYTAPSGNIYTGVANHQKDIDILRITKSTNNHSGIVTIQSIGTVKNVSVVWGSEYNQDYKLSVYTNSNKYASSNDLYSTTKKTCGLEETDKIQYKNYTSVDIAADNSPYIGLLASNSMQFKSITIKWEPSNYTRSTTVGSLGTICVPYSVSSTEDSGAKFFTIAGKVVENGIPTQVIFNEVTSLTAGYPYIFLAEDESMNLNYTKGSATTTTEAVNGLYGTFTRHAFSEDTGYAQGNYYIINSNNELQAASINSGVKEFRAFIKMDEVQPANPTTQVNVRRLTITENGFCIDEPDVSHIENNSAETDTEDESIYTISGIRINQTTELPHGIYIKAGKKFVIR